MESLMAKERKAKKASKQKKGPVDQVTMGEMIAAQQELKALKKEHGLEDEKEGAISRAISKGFEKRENRQKQILKKKTYLTLLLLTGWIGGHRWYAHRWILAVLYTGLFWTGLPLAMSLIDLLEVIPVEADENGCIEI